VMTDELHKQTLEKELNLGRQLLEKEVNRIFEFAFCMIIIVFDRFYRSHDIVGKNSHRGQHIDIMSIHFRKKTHQNLTKKKTN